MGDVTNYCKGYREDLLFTDARCECGQAKSAHVTDHDQQALEWWARKLCIGGGGDPDEPHRRGRKAWTLYETEAARILDDNAETGAKVMVAPKRPHMKAATYFRDAGLTPRCHACGQTPRDET